MLVEAVSNGGQSPIAFEEIVEVTRVRLELAADKRRWKKFYNQRWNED